MSSFIKIFTDGSWSPKTKCGGWAVVVYHSSRPVMVYGGGLRKTTAPRAELIAIVNALQLCYGKKLPITVYTDNQYAVKGYYDDRLYWEEHGWETTSGTPVKNQDLWHKLIGLVTDNVVLEEIDGHTGIPGNELANDVAVAMRKEIERENY